MDTSMDSITIEVNAAAKSSTAEVDNLTQKLDALRKSLEKTIATAGNFSKLKMPDMSSKSSISKSLSNGNKKPFAEYGNLGNQLNKYHIDLDALKDDNFAKLIDSKQSGSAIGSGNVSKAADAMKKYQLATGEVLTITEKTRNGLTGFKVTLDNVSSSAKNNGLKDMKQDLDNVNTSANNSTSVFQKLKGGLGLIGNIGKGIAAFGSMKVLGSTFGKYYKEATDYIEAQNLFTVTLRDNLKNATTFADNFSSKLHLDPADVKQYMGAFNSLITGLGVGSKKALTMSENMTQLVYDLASFKNLSVDTANKKLMSAMSGKLTCLIRKGLRIVINLIQWNSKHVMV